VRLDWSRGAEEGTGRLLVVQRLYELLIGEVLRLRLAFVLTISYDLYVYGPSCVD
jgi:hypothetical protein